MLRIASFSPSRFIEASGNQLNRCLEKLSSGLRINRASDDAAGLAISERLRAKTQGLQQTAENIQNGVNLLQTAEGGMETIEESVQRLRVLAIAAVNDTLSPEERASLQLEVDSIRQGINQIADSTRFNGMKLLNGNYSHETSSLYQNDTFNRGSSVSVTLAYTEGVSDYLLAVPPEAQEYSPAIKVRKNGVLLNEVGGSGEDGFFVAGDGVHLSGNAAPTAGGGQATYQIEYASSADNNFSLNPYPVFSNDVTPRYPEHYITPLNHSETGEDGYLIDEDTLRVSVSGHLLTSDSYTLDKNGGPAINGQQTFQGYTVSLLGDARLVGNSGVQIGYDCTQFISLSPMTFEGGGKIGTLSVDPITVDSLDLNEFYVLSARDASEAIGLADAAIGKISAARGNLAGRINSLSHEYANTTNMELLSAQSESTIRDADMAHETMAWTRSQILTQSGVAIAAQSNSLKSQQILSLLQH